MHLKRQCILSTYFTFIKPKLFFSIYIDVNSFVLVVNLISKMFFLKQFLQSRLTSNTIFSLKLGSNPELVLVWSFRCFLIFKEHTKSNGQFLSAQFSSHLNQPGLQRKNVGIGRVKHLSVWGAEEQNRTALPPHLQILRQGSNICVSS